MNTEALFLFLILLLGIVISSFLGGREGFSGNFSGTFKLNNTDNPISGSGASTSSSNKYDNYNHFTRSSTRLSPGSTYYGPQGTAASVFTDSNGSQTLQIVLPGTSMPTTFQATKPTTNDSSVNVERFGNQEMTTNFFGPNGSTASVINTNNGQHAIKVSTSSGTYYYNVSGEQPNTDISSTQYYGSTGSSIEPHNQAYDKGSSNQMNASQSKQTDQNISYNAFGDYSSTLPPGIPRSQISPGQEDLYILKTQIVPPVCPVCPQVIQRQDTIQRQERCPSCARCPESSFQHKKDLNYNAMNSDALPTPVLADFSQFGM